MKMEKEKLKHAKKHWYKGSLYFKDAVEKQYTKENSLPIKYLEVEMYIGKRSVVMNCYNSECINLLSSVFPQEKMSVWFSTESHKHNGGWNTYNTIKHIEVSRLLNLEKMRAHYNQGGGFNFEAHNEDF
jgi:hypothetical protein